MAVDVSSLSPLLFEGGMNAYAVLDGASVPGLLDRLRRWQPEHVCLYRGELEPALAAAAPYLVALRPYTEFADWVLGQGWGNHWGVFAATPADLRTLRKHFRTFLIVHGVHGRPVYFRYYDPRVLRLYLPRCHAAELAVVFGPVGCYVLEDENPGTLLRFRAGSGKLQQERLRLGGPGAGNGHRAAAAGCS